MSAPSHPRVVVVGGGLAGLTAARDLLRRGLRVHVLEARDRLGGRVHTLRDADGIHVEAGGEFIDGEHEAIRALAGSLRVSLRRVLPGGFGLALDDGRRTTLFTTADRPWRALERRLRPFVDAYREAGARWDTATAAALARRSVDALVPPGTTPRHLRAFVESLRGFYLSEPATLSALVLIDQLLGGEPPGRTTSFRIAGGNDRLIEALARQVRRRGRIDVLRIAQRIQQHARGVRVVASGPGGKRREIAADYAIVALPPPLVLDCAFDPPLPVRQRAALASLSMGAATKVSLRFDRPWWRHRGRPRAFGSNLPCGAIWESAEEQQAAVLTFLGGASVSGPLALASRDPRRLTAMLRRFGRAAGPGSLVGEAVSWEQERWSRGGYAVFGPDFAPRDRPLLAAAHGRVLFAGEHASERWQGFMNGAVESGHAAARDVLALARLDGL